MGPAVTTDAHSLVDGCHLSTMIETACDGAAGKIKCQHGGLPVGGVPGVRVTFRMTARADTYTGDHYNTDLVHSVAASMSRADHLAGFRKG